MKKKVIIPEVLIEKKFSGNHIKQLVEKQTSAIITNPEKMILKDEHKREIYIIRKGNDIPSSCQYVLHSNIKPTIENIYSDKIYLNWAKHPKLIRSMNKNEILKSWESTFTLIEEDKKNGIPGLRSPQSGALFAALSHFRVSKEIGTIVMPTGTGKTETMLSLLIHEKCNCLLVSVPTDALRDQLSEKFCDLGLLKTFGIVSKKADFPIIGIMKKKYKDIDELKFFINSCNVIVATMNILTGYTEKFQKLIAGMCSHYFIDEAHHAKATTWDQFLDHFKEKNVLQFTATPFRNDGKRLNGQIIFNYPLKKAQEDGYFTHIDFNPIYEYDQNIVDEKLAEKGVSVLRNDLEKGYNHILMARCKDTTRAKKIFELYRKYDEFKPVMLHSKMSINDKRLAKKNIMNCNARIVVCVDMLGEGFDLPNLKVAVFHDIRRSLPITLQLVGRFTRAHLNEKLGNATFVANLFDVTVKDELEELYSHDSDWNKILSSLSSDKINDEIEFSRFLEEFNESDGRIPIQNIRPALSAVVYKSKRKSWSYKDIDKALNVKSEDVFYHDINKKTKVIVVVRGKKSDVEWGNVKEIQNITWDLIVIYHNEELGLLFINSTDKSSLYANLAESILGEKVKLINKSDVFRAFHEIKRIRLQNVGLKEFLGRNIRFRMSVGADVEEALSIEEMNKGQKSFVYGSGYENGEKISLGCSFKGRIWTRLVGDLKALTVWCDKIGRKLIDNSINGHQILKETLIPQYITTTPKVDPISIDWDEEIIFANESIVEISCENINKYLFEIDLSVERNRENRMLFSITLTDNIVIPFELFLFSTKEGPSFKIELLKEKYSRSTIKIKNKSYNLLEYLNTFPPTIWFVDGSSLCGNEYVELKQVIRPYNKDRIIAWNWDGVDISKEAQGVYPKIEDSIQFKVIAKLKEGNYDIIYDDDGSGEIADIVTIKQVDETLNVELYHLKYSKKGTVNQQIANLYEVCGQAQKSINWKHKEAKEFFRHLIKRKTKTKKENTCSRFEKGDEALLSDFLHRAKNSYQIKFIEYIVQPGLSKSNATNDQLTLLGVTSSFLKEYGGIELHIIASE